MLNYNNPSFAQPIKHQQLKGIKYDISSLLNINKQKYKNPALTKNCCHPNSCFEMDEALQEIQNSQQYQCPVCKSQARSPNDLVEDWRVQAYQEFNELVEEVLIIQGLMFHKYQKNISKYQKIFTQQEYLKQFRNMFERVNNETLINSIIQKDLYQQHQNKQDKINIWCVCMLDQVKINIPVRIIGCKHYECYELTSLLFFQEQNRKKQEWFECKQSQCSNRLRITHKDYSIKQDKQTEEQDKILDIQTLFSGISVDFDLLNAIKKSIPTSLKFYYNKETEANMFKDMSYINGTNIFEYQGEQYMLQEFMYKLRIRREVYIASLQEKQVIFNQLFCTLNPNLRIKYPLIIQNCENKNIIDFKSFYEELKKIDFDLESKGLILCKQCNYCNENPIKSIIGNIYFHEAFYEALNKYYQNAFTYYFAETEKGSFVVQSNQIQK